MTAVIAYTNRTEVHSLPITVKHAVGGLTFRDVSLRRRGLLLLDELNADIGAGETVAVMGRSGAGKTTLLRTIAGLSAPNGGRVNRPAGRVPMVFQDPRLLPWRTARQNVELVLEPGERHRAMEWLERVGLADAADAYPLMLSGGMRQRVAIARALACEAPLLLVDEPFSHLDVVTARELRSELIRQIREIGCTTIWVTHDPAEAAQVAERSLIMAGPPDGSWQLLDHRAHDDAQTMSNHLAAAIAQDSGREFATVS